ncbi:arylsulfatase [Rufibacter radiotolerans]|uniref:arylsulfatase n=1 Tax=Rufibacter radiotolerans TaxID=1379910 RepID=UPI000971526C|nr:arylsulfatase [Rufibacter radiotolerans]
MQNNIRFIGVVAFIVLSLFASLASYGQGKNAKPNILVIMADDMGYSDLGCYGAEIATPNLDKLAGNGIKLTQFYNTGRCCPTRASLLTGLYPHKTGMGWMTGYDMMLPGYRGDLNKNNVTIAEALKPAGYASYAVGKWHVSATTAPKGPKHNWPVQRGFDKYYGIIAGSGSFFTPGSLTNNNERITAQGTNYYLTDAITDTASQYISQHVAGKAKAPFFLYVAYTAPHWPLHARESDIQKYMKTYAAGWDALRAERYARQLKMGLLDKSVKLTERDKDVPAWRDIPEKDRGVWVKRMATYAAQVDVMDRGVGKILETLRKSNQLENTLVIFLSDNGGCSEDVSRQDKSLEKLGSDESYESYRTHWANLSNTPYRLYKSHTHEGGINAPFIVSWPAGIKQKGTMNRTPSHLIDLMPTFLEMAGAQYPTTFKGNAIHALPGRSLLPMFKGQAQPERPLFWEHEANRAVRLNDWKLVSVSTAKEPYIQAWELYNLANDKAETNNLAAKNPEKVKELEALWNQWAQENDVLPLNGEGMGKRGQTYKRKK